MKDRPTTVGFVLVFLAESPWAFGWTAIAGIATAALAALTWWLAKSTRDLASETDQDIRAQWRPILIVDMERPIDVVIAQGLDPGDEHVRIEMRIVNRGRGPALNCVLRGEAGASTYKCSFEDVSIAVLAVDETREVEVSGFVPKSDSPTAPTFAERLVATYTDIAQNMYITRLELAGRSPLYDKNKAGAYTTTLSVKSTAVGVTREQTTSWPRLWKRSLR